MSDTTQAEEAAMYRWLRDRGEYYVPTKDGAPSPWAVCGTGHWDAAPCSGSTLDAAIRQAMGADDAAGVPVAHPTDGERDLAALCVRLVRRLREVSPDDKLGATATEYLGQRRYLNPLRIKALEKAAPGVSMARPEGSEPSPTDGSNK